MILATRLIEAHDVARRQGPQRQNSSTPAPVLPLQALGVGSLENKKTQRKQHGRARREHVKHTLGEGRGSPYVKQHQTPHPNCKYWHLVLGSLRQGHTFEILNMMMKTNATTLHPPPLPRTSRQRIRAGATHMHTQLTTLLQRSNANARR